MPRDIALKALDIHKRFGDVKALNGVSFEIRRGETKVIIGPNGAGKSTFLKCLNLLVKPDKGRIWLDDIEITSNDIDIRYIRRRIGFVFQEINLFRHLTALENVMIGLRKVRKMPREEAFKKAVETLEMVEIDKVLWNRYPAQLSGGQRQRVAIARALAMDPDIMLYDEPTSALDPRFAGEILKIIKRLSDDGMTSIIVTHELGFAREVADEIIFMYNGRIVERGKPDKILSNPKTEFLKIFLLESDKLYRVV